MVQLRAKDASDDEVLAAAARFRALCDEHGALFWLNDRPDLALEAGADGVHVGQDDIAVAEVREQVGDRLLIGLSTHSPAQLEAALHLVQRKTVRDQPVERQPAFAVEREGLGEVALRARRAVDRAEHAALAPHEPDRG